MKFRSLLFVLLLLVVPALAQAVPLQIPYSGQLSEGGTLVNGTRSMSFIIYDVASGGTALYTQPEPSVTVTNGVYHVELNAPSTVWTGADRWLGVSVSGGAELTPRTKVGSVPYAIRANVADAISTLPPVAGGNFVSDNATVGVGTVFGSGWTPAGQVTVNCPAAGYLLAISCGLAYGGPQFDLVARLSETTPPNNYYTTLARTTNTTGSSAVPLSVTEVLPVGAGSHTVTLWLSQAGNGVSFTYYLRTIQAIWFPNRYQ